MCTATTTTTPQPTVTADFAAYADRLATLLQMWPTTADVRL